MTLDESIDLAIVVKGELLRDARLEKASAINLLIEAGKRDQYHRKLQPDRTFWLLPGETEGDKNDAR